MISDQEIERKLSLGKALGVREILLISGERPDRLEHIRAGLAQRGWGSFIEFASDVARKALDRGFLPHGNYGALSLDELKVCREFHASMGVMLENVEDDREVAPEKRSASRLETIRNAGVAKVPFTSGILLGVGETRLSRIRSLEALAELHDTFGHLQEIIIQNFIPNSGSKLMHSPNPPSFDEYLELIQFWRERCPNVALQIPPNLNSNWLQLLSQIDDLGGISPERDEVNPENRWKTLEVYRAQARLVDVRLQERLAVYPDYQNDEWLSRPVLKAIQGEPRSSGKSKLWQDALWNLSTAELLEGARSYRLGQFGKQTTFVVNRNANFTNVCNVGCSFCGFARKRSDRDAYLHSPEAIVERLRKTPEVTEVCLQGGIHPDLSFEYYRDLLTVIKTNFPKIHIHAFSPMEIQSLHLKTGRDYQDIFKELKDAGLGSVPGTAAEILVDSIRRRISGNKLDAKTWEKIIRSAHESGLSSTATIMYGHIESWDDVKTHFEIIRRIQEDTGGFTEFVPLAFIPYRNALGRSIRKGSFDQWEAMLRKKAERLYPLARLFFTDLIPHLQTSWVKLGVEGAVASLDWGCDDFGGTLYEESITRESGGPHGECLTPQQIYKVLEESGYKPIQRTTLYEEVRMPCVAGV